MTTIQVIDQVNVIEANSESILIQIGAAGSLTVGAGLTGGGPLNQSISVALNTASIASLALADSAVQPGDNISVLVDDLGLATDGDIAAAIGSLSAVFQPLDTTLTSVAGLTTPGIVVLVDANTAITRAIEGVAQQTTIVNGAGVAGNISIGLAAEALASLALADSALQEAPLHSIVGTDDEIIINNIDPFNPVISLDTPVTASLLLADSALQVGDNVSTLVNDAGYLVPADLESVTLLLSLFNATEQGVVPASGGGTTNFLRADGTFAAPVGTTGANPTASVGLAAVNGTATTFMRSDAAPALVQNIAPTWTGIHTFTANYTQFGNAAFVPALTNGVITVNSNLPAIYFYEADAPTDRKVWRQYVSNGNQIFESRNDADNDGAPWLTVSTTNGTDPTVHFPNTISNAVRIGSPLALQLSSFSAVLQVRSLDRAAVLLSPTAATATIVTWNSATSGNNIFHSFVTEDVSAPTERGSISYNRGSGVVAYNTTSDERLKSDIYDSESASSIIDAIQVRQFNWKETGNHYGYGFVAQELNTVFPTAVTPGDDSEEITQPWQVDYSKLVPLLVKEIQALRARVEQLESQVK